MSTVVTSVLDAGAKARHWDARCGQGCSFLALATGRAPVYCTEHDLPCYLTPRV